ncbi:MAG: peptidylprolyl isomerase [Bacteroidaceae bacterium]|nr:peptidylprolyl isomerase [Bacteroidaceae bacterium]
MKRTTAIRSLLTLLALVATLTANAQDNIIDEVMWVVGDEAILKSDVENARLLLLSRGQRIEGDPYCVIPEQLAIQKLFINQAAVDSIEVTENEIISAVNEEIEKNIAQYGSKEKMEQFYQKTTTQIREQLRETKRDELLVQGEQMKIFGDIKLTPAEVRQRYAQMSEDEIPYVPTEVEVQIITQHPVIPQDEIELVKEKLRDITERIQKGETSFAIQAVMYSQDGSASNGGELPFMGRGEFVPEFAAVAFNLTDPTKISKIVETEFGYHIIQLIEKRGDRIKVRHILMKPETPQESIDEMLLRLDSIANDIRNGKFTFEEAALLSDDKETRANYGIMHNGNYYSQNYGSPRFEMQDLPQEVAKTVNEMKVGEISDPFVMTDPKSGKKVCAVVKLKTRVNGHKATVQDDFQALKDVMIAQIREEKMEKWIVEKQKTTYIHIDDKWKHGEFKYPGWVKDN